MVEGVHKGPLNHDDVAIAIDTIRDNVKLIGESGVPNSSSSLPQKSKLSYKSVHRGQSQEDSNQQKTAFTAVPVFERGSSDDEDDDQKDHSHDDLESEGDQSAELSKGSGIGQAQFTNSPNKNYNSENIMESDGRVYSISDTSGVDLCANNETNEAVRKSVEIIKVATDQDDDLLDDLERVQEQDATIDNRDVIIVELRFCTACDLEQPIRTRHCRDCDRCVATHDHHCPWLGTCVAEKNRAYFYVYLMLQLTELLWGFQLAYASYSEEETIEDW
eukprot:CAMPEP_0114973384 /NCGR_PEP_ID=MMETSP0216-20121206/923_1 /TAXON_ID=223996 /ORGANISM="Protocruzia adherens, Strain Boccale" /LENGTH=274 /DNA_ID=CAMNT_0002333867 /DNA_START=201 /DNA_END=1022 /DNA_ORIENTATION=-